MPFGGLGGALPIRLGGGLEYGWAAGQHARLCADLTAVARTMPALSLLVATDGATVSLVRYSGRNGTGPQLAPAFAWDLSTLTVDLGAYTNNLGFEVDVLGFTGTSFAVVITDTANERPVPTTTNNGAVISIPWTYGSAAIVRIDVYAANDVQIGDYDGHIAKRNSVTEGTSTYAFTWYRILKSAQGTAFSQRDDTVRSWALKAEARALGTSQRISEMLAASSTPHGSDYRLPKWAKWLGVQTANLPTWEVREQCEDSYADRDMQTASYIETKLAEILGPVYSSVQRNYGTLSAWPSGTYEPGYADGDFLYDVSGFGVYSSSRCNLTVIVNQGSYADAELVDLMSREVAVWLDNTLPATATWDWSISTGGFVIGTAKIGMTSI